jgi:hypothetical protein
VQQNERSVAFDESGRARLKDLQVVGADGLMTVVLPLMPSISDEVGCLNVTNVMESVLKLDDQPTASTWAALNPSTRCSIDCRKLYKTRPELGEGNLCCGGASYVT